MKGGRDADPRQQTLKATIEWSHELLSAEEQQLFARLSVFAGGCTLESAEDVADADLDTLQSLVEKSLLRFTNERFWMLETIREYAGERLGAREDTIEIAMRHADWCRRLAEASERAWLGIDAPEWVDHIEQELDNVRGAIDYGLERNQLLALSIAADTWYFWSLTGRSLEARRTLDAAWTEDAPVDLRKRALRAVTSVALKQNDFSTVMSVSQERLTLARATNDVEQEAAALNMLASGATLSGDAVEARAWFEEAIALNRSTGSESGLMTTLANFAHFERDERDLSKARALSEESLAISRAQGSEVDVAWALKELAATLVEQGAMREARVLVAEALEIASRVGLVDVLQDLVLAVATIATRSSRAADAGALFGAIETMYEQSGFEILATDSEWWGTAGGVGDRPRRGWAQSCKGSGAYVRPRYRRPSGTSLPTLTFALAPPRDLREWIALLERHR